jgi:hypothetical protein
LNTDEISEIEMNALEALIPAQARKATHDAFQRALQERPTGVLCIDEGYLVRRLHDGTKIIKARAKPRRKVVIDQVVTVRKVSR